MAYTGNKGEWSELYVFFKLLSEGKLYCGDGHLNRYEDRYYPILEIFRDDKPERNSYKINEEEHRIEINGRSINIVVPQDEFGKQANDVWNMIQEMSHTASNDSVEEFMHKIDCGEIKASSTDKADIRLVLHKLQAYSKPDLGYSIKSKAGAASTLINASQGTNFLYEVKDISDEQVDEFNKKDKFRERFALLDKIGAKVDYLRPASEQMRRNLVMLDIGLDKIIGCALLYYYMGKCNEIEMVMNLVKEVDPLNVNENESQPIYEYKVKQFLLAFALGMNATKPWMGKFAANGGYIIVKRDGDVVCYHCFDRNDLEDYLYYNTRFETPSTSRHEFGNIYKNAGKYYLKLCLQVRFLK